MALSSSDSDLRVRVLGCSGSYAAPGNPCSGYLVQSPEATVLLDCGPGVLGPLQEAASFDDLTAVVITHAHGDHWLDLPMIHTAYKWFHPRDFEERPIVYLTRQTRILYDRLSTRHSSDDLTYTKYGIVDELVDANRSKFSKWFTRDNTSSSLPCRIITRGLAVSIGDQSWRFAKTKHGKTKTYAVRVDSADGRSFAFSADTGPGWDFRSLGESIDLAMCEASHSATCNGRSDLHMTPREAVEATTIAGIQRLVITHVAPCCDPDEQTAEASSIFRGSVEVARPGLVLNV